MFRLIALLLATLGALMYYADDIFGPAGTETVASVNSPAPVIPEVIQPEPVADEPVVILPVPNPELIVLTPATTFRQPSEGKPGYVPFLHPAIVNADGTIVEPSIDPTDQVVVQAPTPEAQPEQTLRIRYVTGRSVNVREGPSTNHPVLGQVIFAEAVQILSDPTKDWVLIRIEGDGIEGFMASRFLQSENPQG